MIELIPKSELPGGHLLSPYLLEKADHVAKIMLSGKTYYIPIGLHERRLMGIRIKDGRPVFNVEKHGWYWRDFLQNIIGAIYLQVRDTVGSELHSELTQEINESFSKLFSDVLEKKIEAGLPKPKLLTDGKERHN